MIVELTLEDATRLTGRDTRAEAQARRDSDGLPRIHSVVHVGADRAVRPEEHPAQSGGQDDRRRIETKIATQPVETIASLEGLRSGCPSIGANEARWKPMQFLLLLSVYDLPDLETP